MTKSDVTGTRRLFFALWPDSVTRARLTEALRAVMPPQVRATPGDNLHITLAFLGSLDAASQHCAEQAAARVRATPFILTLDDIGYWSRPRILWLGTQHCPDALLELEKDLRHALQPCKTALDERPYQPHLTYARKVRALEALPALAAPVEWRVSDYALVESQPAEDGTHYRVLATWPLSVAR